MGPKNGKGRWRETEVGREMQREDEKRNRKEGGVECSRVKVNGTSRFVEYSAYVKITKINSTFTAKV